MRITVRPNPIIAGVVFGVVLTLIGLWLALTYGRTYHWPAAGASYALGTPMGTMGDELPSYADETPSQTLQVTLADTARISELTFKNMELGKSGLLDCVAIERDAGNLTGYLHVDTMLLTGISAPTFDMAEAEIGTLTLAGQVDGHTNSSTLDPTITDQTVTSLRGTGSFVSDGGVVDRIVIVLLGDATVANLTFDNVKCSFGAWDVDYVKAGTLTQDITSKVGDGTGIDVASYTIQTSVKYRIGSDSLQDVPVTVR